ncbi:hypothetical protein AMATHDRAFT_139300 [Amanita thiersii Skay4041]|uniref:EF-hand domain-containing protein n=1 Tax=Amanita thiersii Skay4041 TaxID=703135 RepID=A0A2A9NXV5_9AGAR|nr:hypothetical protein AMATHDRAFT_139300 [Amanita thiersii Skay4041]
MAYTIPTSPAHIPLHHSHTLASFRDAEGTHRRRSHLRDLWLRLPDTLKNTLEDYHHLPTIELTPSEVVLWKKMYDTELLVHCGVSSEGHPGSVGWNEFISYVNIKEAELWDIFHNELDLNGDGLLNAQELSFALRRAGIDLTPERLSEFIAYLNSSPQSHVVTFNQFRDFLLLLPRKASPAEIYRYYTIKKHLCDAGKGSGPVIMNGDISLNAQDKPPDSTPIKSSAPMSHHTDTSRDDESADEDFAEDDDEHPGFLGGNTSLKFLLAGGIAGAVSRTCTAPFDRLKVFLITRPLDLGGTPVSSRPSLSGVKVIGNAVARIYAEGGVLAFWTGNGLSVAKIFPESAIKFFAYESAKRAFALYWDKVDDPRDISGASRFLSGGIGGITSQLTIYPIETLKTQMMSNTGQRRSMVEAARHVWTLGGMRAYYRGLMIGLIGVFPYSAIDMSAFEALKLTYLKSTGKEEPGVMALLAFGSISGSVGATSVYPLNLVRTRLQASGSPGHPQRYSGVWDVAVKTWERDGWRGFYRGLFPTLAKVVPSVSISYVVYEHSKRR